MIDPLILRPDKGILTRDPQLVKLADELSEIYADRKKLVTDNVLQFIGALLWRALDADEPFRQARTRAGQHLLPIVIERAASRRYCTSRGKRSTILSWVFLAAVRALPCRETCTLPMQSCPPLKMDR